MTTLAPTVTEAPSPEKTNDLVWSVNETKDLEKPRENLERRLAVLQHRLLSCHPFSRAQLQEELKVIRCQLAAFENA